MLAALVLLLHALGACVSAQQMSLLPAASYQAQLLAQRDAITNWQAFASANNITGWEDDLNAYKAVPVCEWSGIACNSFDGSVTQLNWTCGDCVVQAEGTLAPEMAEISSLQELIISGQLISGTLPEAWSKKGMFTGLTTLLLDYNQLDGPLPASFGGADAFPNLVNMKLSGNFLTGTLPGSWGNFTGLEQLYLDYNTLTGDLPASWGAANAFRKLKALYIGNNAFASTLPAAWGSATAFPSLTDIALDSAAMIGTLPASWGSEGAWPKLFILELALNQITGLLPSAWAGNGAFPQLSSLSLSSNDLSGSIPAAWGNPSAWPSLEAVGLGNNPSLCGSVPPSLYASVCAAPLPFGTECVGTDLPACVASFPPATAEDVAALLAQKQAISNWDKLVSGLELDGWNESVQVCSWTGVGCTENGSIISVDLSCPSEEEVQDGAPACGQRAQGVLAPELASISTLQSLNFANLGLSGTLPAAWGKPNSFSNLNILTLDLNNLTGTLPDAFPRRLQTVSMGNNDLSGSLPQSWGDASSVPVLSYLYLAGNKLSGPLPGIWGSSEALGYLGYLDLSNNTISGTLPSAWGQNGSFPRLTELYLTNNNITGGLPDSWAAAGAFSKLSDMSLENNMLSGSIPEIWNATDALPSLQQLVLVGNEELCGAVPYTMLKPVCGTEPSQCDTNDEIPCVTPPPAQQDDSSSSSVPVGAIVGGVLGGLSLVAMLLFFAFRKGWLRRRGAPVGCAKQDSTSGKAPSSSKLFGDSGDAESPGKGLPLVPPLDPPALTLLPGQAHEGRADSTLPLSYITTLGMGYEQSASGTSFGSPSDALPTTLSSSLHSLETDPMLSFISSRMGPTRQHSGILPSPTSSTGFTSASAPLSAEVQQWEVQWEHIQLQRPIGRGSFGKVYLANWQATPVAVKILINAEGVEQSPSLELPDEVMKQLQEEAVVMSRMRHPNLVSFMGLCTLPPCILTEFCSRGSLYDVLRQASWSPEVASDLTWRLRLSMASDAARGLLYLHLRSPAIIHGDVKSPNMLVDRSWNVKVCDFNLSHVIFKYQHQPAAPSSDATNPTWLAPEVLSGQRATAAADVYSFALVLWELLTWKLPWSRMPPYQVRRAVLEGHRPELPSCDALPGPDGATAAELEEYCQLIRDCWAQDPEDRPSLEAIVPRLSAMLDQAVQTASSLDH